MEFCRAGLGRWLLLWCCMLPSLLHAQNYPTRHFTMRDGLPSMAIRTIFQDSRGLLWIGTDAGLCNFDGNSFRIFKFSEGMTANMIWAIAEDEQGNMWFGSYGEGLYKYDGRKFKRFSQKDGLIGDRIRTLCWSRNFHCLVVGSEGGISTIWNDRITNSHDEIFTRGNGGTVTGLADAGKFIYITTYSANNPLRYYPDKNLFVNNLDKKILNGSGSFSAYISLKGDTVFSCWRGVKIIKQDGIAQCDSMDQVFGISEDKRGDLWMASWSYPNRGMTEGVFRYDGKSFKNYKEAFGITDKEIWTVFCDRKQDILWIGTLNEGLFMVPHTAFENFPAAYFHLQNQKINDIFIDSKNSIWISGNRELIRMLPDGSFSFMNKHPMLLSLRRFWSDRQKKNYSGLDTKASMALKLGNTQLPNFEKVTDFEFKNVIEEAGKSIFFTNIFGLFNYHEDHEMTDFIGPDGTFGDFALFGRDTLLTTQWGSTRMMPDFRNSRTNIVDSLFIYFSKETESMKKGDPWNVNRLVKHGNQFWYATLQSGLWMSEGLKLIHFNETDSTISNNLNDICFDEFGHVIFGSNTGEICIATFADQKLKIEYRIGSDQGLQGSSISWLVADQKGRLWAGTNMGLNCIDLNTIYNKGKFLVRFLDEGEGYAGHTAKRAVLDRQGNLWIGAREQLIKLNTGDYFLNRQDSGKIILNSIEINHVPVDSLLKKKLDPWTSLPVQNIKLKYSDNNFTFYYDILNYNNPDKDKFRYMLRGYDNDWNEGGAGRKGVYTNLPSGKYTFTVEAVNLSTNTKAEPLNFEFTIDFPWWKLWYVDSFGVLLILTVSLWILRRYSETKRKKLLEKSDVEKKIVELEMQALQAQMNPHFIFNCVSGIQYFILANKKEEVLEYLSDFSKIVRESLANATLRMIPLEQVIGFLRSYIRLEQMRFPDKFDCSISFRDGLETDFVRLPPMLVQPFVENAISHGFTQMDKMGHLSILFETAGQDLLKCTITDNGVGRGKTAVKRAFEAANDRLHSGAITETRIKLFNPPGTADKYKIVYTDLFEDGIPVGLQVELYLPMEFGDADL